MDTDRTNEPMKPRKGRRFRKTTKYVHRRSEGMTERRNGGSRYQGRAPYGNTE